MVAMRRLVRKVAARFGCLMLIAGVTLAGGERAQAFNHGDCYIVFAAANVAKVTPVRIDAGGADFGDHGHFLGAPQGNAVICWSTDGRVAVKGLVFADSFAGPLSATVRIRFRRSNGTWTSEFVRSAATQGGPFPASTLAYVVSPQGNFRRVRVRLFTTTESPLGLVTRRVASRNFDR